MTNAEAFARRVEYYCGNESVGYSQYHRWCDPDVDCSSLMYICAYDIGLPVSREDPRYTGTMVEDFAAAGCTIYDFDGPEELKRGDILLNVAHHTIAYLGDGKVGGARQSETGGIYGEGGDQTGDEVCIHGYYIYPGGWDYFIRMPEDGSTGAPTEAAEIDCDGWWGEATTKALQRQLGCVVDGEIWHQWPENAQEGCTSGWCYDYSQAGSPLIREMQRRLGVYVDGIMGKDTIKALQKRFGCVVDGVLDGPSPCVKAMQEALNAGNLPF